MPARGKKIPQEKDQALKMNLIICEECGEVADRAALTGAMV